MRSPVLLAKRKWPDRSHYDIDAFRLGVDDHGTWLGSAAGATVRRDGVALFDVEHDALHLVPGGGVWWTVWFNQLVTYVDVCVPAVDEGDVISFVDLDLDVIRDEATGLVRLEDEDELEQHVVELGYPPHLLIGARASAAAVAAMLSEERGPFATGVVERWWEALEERSS